MHTLTGLLAGSVICLTACTAHARDDEPGGFLLPGLLWGVGPAKTLGGEISYAHYPNGCCWGYGPRVDLEWLQPKGAFGGTYRTSLGAELFVAGLGLEASVSRQGARDLGPRAGFGGAFGAFASLGFGSIGVRHTWAFDQGDAPVTALVFTAKWMILFYGEDPYRFPSNWGRMPSGRPLVVREEAIVASLARCSFWDGAGGADGPGEGIVPDEPIPCSPPRSLRARLLRALS